MRQHHSVFKRGKQTRLPKTEDEKASPLHVDNVRPMNVGLLRGRMSETTRARFDETWRRTFDVAKLRPSSSRRVSRLQAKHAEELELNGIAQRASGPGRSVNVPFTVVEEKEGALRQRFILWTHEANDAIEADGYEAQVPLKHVSTYLDAVHAECGSTRDLRCGFYGVEVPRGARDAFRFQDDAGDWWELTRLPMGHTCAPELMHTLTSTIAGHPDFVKTVHAVPAAVTVHTWVDNVRYAGSRKDVLEASRKVDELAARSKVTWKDADTRTASTRYEFIGVDWDHQSGKVGISARLSKKLARDLVEVRKGAMSASGLETLGGRLLHASAIVGVFVGEFYFALKFLRRLTNALNRGEKAVDQTVRLSGSVQRLLDGWVRAVLEKRRMPVTARVPSLTVFVDASLEGWGGVLVDVATNAIEVLGSRWSRKEKGLHINELEALAFELCVSAVPDKYAGGTVTVVVDNTTVQGVARKGACLRSQTLNDAVVNGLTRLRHMNISLSTSSRSGDREVLAAVRRALDADHLLPSDRSDQNPTTGLSRESGRTNSSQFPASSLGVADVLKPSARAASVIGQAIHELVASKAGVGISRALAARHKENGVSVAEAHRRLQQAVGRAWASSTVDDRRNMWRRFQAWASGRGLGLNPDVAVLFVVATSVEPQGMLGYSRLLSAVFGHMGVDSKPLKVLASVLRGDGASIPLSQAEGIPRETLISWARRQVPHLRLAAFVAWKTASRWAEVRLLTRPCFVLVSTTEVIIDWGTLPKGRSRNPYCLSKTAVIRGALTEEIAALVRGAGNFSPLTPVTTSQLDGMWAREPRMCRYSAHSIKRGAVDHLVCAKAAGAPFPEHLISRLAKHTTDNVDPTLAQMTTRLPKTEDEKASPLHVDNVRPMNVGLLRGRMSETTRARFDETWRRTFDVAKLRPSSSRRVSRLQAKHAEELELNGIAQRASGPGRSVNVPFTVVEEKEGALRQRFILWTHEANDAIEADGYEAQVPLKHVSTYLDAVHAECGSTRDLRCGFYGVEVPRGARDAFRFQDDAGDWWELTRLPMGHTCAPELMHTLTSTIAGHPDFVKTVHAVPAAVTVHTWVDNVRYAGSRKDVLEASRKVDELAARSKVTWKDADTRTASTRYEFIGVDWDHQSGKVGISARLSKKLARDLVEVRKGAMSASGLETLGGRLLHASAIVGVFVGEFYFALKFLRRLTNALNRGEKAVDQTVRLSGSVQRLLDGWVRAVLEKRRMPVTARVPSLTVFVDASLEGWGGVLVDVATNAIEVLGSRWSRKEKGLHINELEALAFELCVSAVPDKYAGGTVTVVVDNTTVQGVARKGACLRSQTLNDAVVNGLTRLRHMNISLSVLLIVFSYAYSYARIGMLVLLVHDSSDVFVCLCKCFHMTNWKKCSHACFVIMVIIWFYARLYLYPVWIISSIFQYPVLYGFNFWFFGGLMTILLVLHIWWFHLFMKIAYGIFQHGSGKDLTETKEAIEDRMRQKKNDDAELGGSMRKDVEV
ncbi:ASC1-like protein 1 [Diplonema papillatum]|nr:ASC1-like protein 1 [Diplonema papillatum]